MTNNTRIVRQRAELKPCPCCKSDAAATGWEMWEVRCSYCGLRTTTFTSRETAVEAWNTRPEETLALSRDGEREAIDRLDADLERLELWCRKQDPNATIWLHLREARELLKSGGRAQTFKGVTTPDTPLWQADGPEPATPKHTREAAQDGEAK